MNSLIEILEPSFLLRDALYNALLVGLVCPLVGVYFVLRRMIFLGVALPQVSASGIAAAFLLFHDIVGSHEHGVIGERTIALAGSFLLTFIALLILAYLEEDRSKTVESRIGITYALAAAATVLFLAKDPDGEAQMVNLLKGDILSATHETLLLSVIVFGVVLAILGIFRKRFLLVSFDRELARVFRINVRGWDQLLFLCIGATISLGVMVAGPLVVFGYLVIPPVTARMFVSSMRSFAVLAGLLGVISAFAGFYLSYVLDLPLGPTEVATACGILLVGSLMRTGMDWFRRSPT